MEFTLNRLTDYSDKDIIREIQRVAKVLNISPLTITSFDRESKVHVTTIKRRFSSWKKALQAADLGHLYGGQIVTKNMREQKNRNISDDELLNELRRVAKLSVATCLFRKEFKKYSEISLDTIQKRLGGWRSALERAGLVNRWSGGTGQNCRYTNEDMIAELHKISATLGGQPVTREVFDRYSQMSSATVLNRFGSWAKALKHAGLKISNRGKRYTQQPGTTNRYSGSKEKNRQCTIEDMIAELHKISAALGGQSVTREVFDRYSKMSSATVFNRFGSWAKALKHAGLKISNRGKRYTQDEYWENLLLVWTHYGRQPTYGEMRHPPSTIGAEAYDAKWGTWRKALLAFIQYANSSTKLSTSVVLEELPTPIDAIDVLSQELLSASKRESPENRREIPLSFRFKIMYRDHFKCVLCGSNPPANPGLILQIDHIKPWSKGGKTEIDNLRTLCAACNIGRGNRYSE